jgi:hypothetical protein
VALFGRRRSARGPETGEGSTFIPARAHRRGFESFVMRIVATGGIVGIGTALAAILGSQDVDAWIIGLVVSAVTVLLAGVLWSSRTM